MSDPVEVYQGIRDQFSVTLGGVTGRWHAVHYTKAQSQLTSRRSQAIPQAWEIVRSRPFDTRDEAKAQVNQWMKEEKTQALLKGE